MKVPSVRSVNRPCDGPLTSITVSEGPSTSLTTTWPETGVSSGVVMNEFCATGASFTAFTVTVTVAGALSRLPSVTR